VTRDALLSVQELVVRFRTSRGTVYAVNGVSFEVGRGETLGLVGESGSGKSVTSLAIMGLLPQPAGRVAAGTIQFEGRNLVELPESELRRIRGKEISMVFQDPMSSLNPVLTIGEQVVETIRAHTDLDRGAARARAAETLGSVGIPRAERQLGRYPHQFSGGMRQRVMIAMALALEPRLLIADEPTTALDVTIQAQVLQLLRDMTVRTGTSLVLISHDLGIMARMAHRIVIMYAGSVMESGPTVELFAHPRHPYTVGLLNAAPRIDDRGEALRPIEGAPPDLEEPPTGCPFAPRCRWRVAACWTDTPPLRSLGSEQLVACHNMVTQQEVAGARPLRPGFEAAPPPESAAQVGS
jgi:oligopeptide/dipeptide ABC transporter ATP-binding protein